MHHASSDANVVILGAGFAGLPVARALAKHPSIHVTVVDPKRDFHFTPRLVDALGSRQVKPSWIKTNLEALAKRVGFAFIHGRATTVSRSGRSVTVETTTGTTTLPYDILLIATGATTNWNNVPGAQEHGFPLKQEEDVDRIHAAVRSRCRDARNADPETQRRLLSFAVVGGGPTGIESIFSLQRYIQNFLKQEVPELLGKETLTLVQAAPQILMGFPHKVVNGTMEELRKHGIAVRVGEPATNVTKDEMQTSSGMNFPASLIVWGGGIQPNVIPMEPEAGRDRSRYLSVDATLRVDERIYAAGDGVAFQEHNRPIPKNAQTALRMADSVATNILRQLRGLSPVPFHYQSLGNLILLGETGFVDIGRFSIKTRFTSAIRHLFYALRHWQIVG